MVAAIWSSGRQTVAEFPRDTLLRFFDNHGLLDISGHPQWRTVSGGSHRYVQAIGRDLGDGVHAGLGVDRIRRDEKGVTLELTDHSSARFDHVVVATHADQALAMLAAPTAQEERLLGAWSYSINDTWLHTDTALMPRRRRAWASWNYLIEDGTVSEPRVSMTYHLNRLQRIPGPTQYFVSLNPPQPPAADRVLRRMTYQHPVYTRASVASQERLRASNGSHRTHYCGAYLRNGFHEDGLWSAVQVAADLGVQFP
jgi:predicted NAD/FAD-binding protein